MSHIIVRNSDLSRSRRSVMAALRVRRRNTIVLSAGRSWWIGGIVVARRVGSGITVVSTLRIGSGGRSSRATMLVCGSRLLLREGAVCRGNTSILGKGEVETVVVPLLSEHNESPSQDRDHQEIKDAEENQATSDADPVATV